MNPAVSVLLPVYNAQGYVAEAVESILAQTFDDFELLIVNDGSTDRSPRILRQFERRDRRIRLVSRENRGLVAALNEMIAMARGEFLARMDTDDVSLPGRLALQVAYLRDHPDVVAVGGAVHLIDEAGRFLDEAHPAMDHDQIQEQALMGRCALNHPSVTMRRDAVVAVGGYRPEMRRLEDLDLWLRLGEVGRIVSLPDVVLKYRQHDQSLCEKYIDEQAEYAKLASDRACERRGIAPRFVPLEPWRPGDRLSRFDSVVNRGWIGYMRGDRDMALAYGAKAVRLMPWKADGWRLIRSSLNLRRVLHEAVGLAPKGAKT
jgi:glycosyltransferase involved in cell wall biosynthesis